MTKGRHYAIAGEAQYLMIKAKDVKEGAMGFEDQMWAAEDFGKLYA